MRLTPSQDVPAPQVGPPFARLASWPYRAEMLSFTIALVGFLLIRAFTFRDVDGPWTVFWFLWPDLAAFMPIGLAGRRGSGWPGWGAALFNIFNTLLVWIPLFLVVWPWLGSPWWPLLGWAVHLGMDRTAGYYLRASSRLASPPAP